MNAYCKQFEEQEGLIGVYHVNPSNANLIESSFHRLVQDVIRDHEVHNRSASVRDDFWDESIKIRKTKQAPPTVAGNNDPNQNNYQEEQDNQYSPDQNLERPSRKTGTKASFKIGRKEEESSKDCKC